MPLFYFEGEEKMSPEMWNMLAHKLRLKIAEDELEKRIEYVHTRGFTEDPKKFFGRPGRVPSFWKMRQILFNDMMDMAEMEDDEKRFFEKKKGRNQLFSEEEQKNEKNEGRDPQLDEEDEETDQLAELGPFLDITEFDIAFGNPIRAIRASDREKEKDQQLAEERKGRDQQLFPTAGR